MGGRAAALSLNVRLDRLNEAVRLIGYAPPPPLLATLQGDWGAWLSYHYACYTVALAGVGTCRS